MSDRCVCMCTINQRHVGGIRAPFNGSHTHTCNGRTRHHPIMTCPRSFWARLQSRFLIRFHPPRHLNPESKHQDRGPACRSIDRGWRAECVAGLRSRRGGVSSRAAQQQAAAVQPAVPCPTSTTTTARAPAAQQGGGHGVTSLQHRGIPISIRPPPLPSSTRRCRRPSRSQVRRGKAWAFGCRMHGIDWAPIEWS